MAIGRSEEVRPDGTKLIVFHPHDINEAMAVGYAKAVMQLVPDDGRWWPDYIEPYSQQCGVEWE